MANFSNKKTFNLNRINKIFIFALFVLVFIISSFLVIPQVKDNNKFLLIWLIVSICFIFVFVLVWIIVYLYIKKKNLTSNTLKIKKIIKNSRHNDSSVN